MSAAERFGCVLLVMAAACGGGDRCETGREEDGTYTI